MANQGEKSFSGALLLCLALVCPILALLQPAPAFTEGRTVRVGVYENAPKIFTAAYGKPSGIFIDVIEAIARTEGWNLTYVSGTWAEGLDRLEQGKIDLMPDVAYTADREKIFSFHAVPVLSAWFQIYAPRTSTIQSILDLNGKSILVLERSVQEEALARISKGFGLTFTLINVPDYDTMFERLARGEADACITNRFYGPMHAKKLGLKDTAIIFEPSDLFFATPKGDPQHLLAAIDRDLEELKKDPNSPYYHSLSRWVSEEVRFRLPSWLPAAGAAAGAALFLSLLGGVLLKYQVNARTRDLQKINQVLGASEQKYRELVMLANSIILRWSPDGRITFLNEFGQRFFGYFEEEIVGRPLVGTIVPGSESTGRDLSSMIAAISHDPESFERNVNENVRRNGERVWIDWTNKMVPDEQGGIKEILSIGSDITARKKSEEEIRRLNEDLRRHAEVLEQRVAERTAELVVAKDRAESADRLKSAFLATMSHELRTPLNSIIGFTGIMLQGLAGPLNPEQQKQMRMVQGSARHLLALINDVLDISKIEADQLEISMSTFALGPSLEKMAALVTPLAVKKGIELVVEVPEPGEMITTDPRRFEQVVINLLNNAVKFTEKGRVCLACRDDGKDYLVSVSDTGIGIAPEELPNLFQAFHQIDTGLSRKHEGTGLGLSICRKLLDLMGGGISVESEPGRGSTFTVRIPKREGGIA
ncbi:MAG: ATP-binding protein [Thermodesulfobacteriota bacterium]